MAEKKRRARGEGNIRQRKDGTWEARFVIGVDPGTGKDIRKSVYARTQKEARQKMTEAVAALDKDDYREPCKMTLGKWMDIWSNEYLGSVKPRTVATYKDCIKNHIKPALGAVKLEILTAHAIQKFYNSLSKSSAEGGKGLALNSFEQAGGNEQLHSRQPGRCLYPPQFYKAGNQAAG